MTSTSAPPRPAARRTPPARPVPPRRAPWSGRSARICAVNAATTALASLALLPLFQPLGWIGPTWTAIGLVALTAFGARALRLPPPLTVLPALFVLLCYLCAAYAPTDAIAGFLPGPGGIRGLADVVRDGFDDIRSNVAPTPVVTPGLTVLVAGGIGLLTIVNDLLAVDLRRPALVGLPLLTLFSIPAAILKTGVGWLPFALCAIGYLALLAAEGHERLERWGRPMRTTRRADGHRGYGDAPPATPSRSAPHVTWRAGASAICLALLIPAVLPGMHAGWFGRHTNGHAGGFGSGDGPVTINPFVSLKRDLTRRNAVTVYTYTTTTATPDYMRLVTLDTFDGVTWHRSGVDVGDLPRASSGLHPDADIHDGAAVSTTVKIAALDQLLLPLPMNSVSVKGVGANWRYDQTSGTVLSTSGGTGALTYDASSLPVTVDAATLRGVSENGVRNSMRQYLELPKNLPSEIPDLAKQVTAGKTNAYDKAVALQNWFTANFAYSLDVHTGHDDDALLSFLRDRTGYCEQFAATMAIMARSLGIPSRVGVGFTSGNEDATSHVWTVTTLDAHAWPELYFPSVGWLRFEPTPRSDGEAIAPGYTNPDAQTGPSPSAQPQSSATPQPSASATANAPGAQQNGGGPTGGGATVDIVPVLLGALAAGLLIALAGAMPTLRGATTRRRWLAAEGDDAETAHVAWVETGDTARDLGVRWHGDTDTPRRTVETLLASGVLRDDPEAQEALQRLGDAEERARYARTAGRSAQLRDDAAQVQAALRRAAPRARRIAATLMPNSAVRLTDGWIAEWRRRLGTWVHAVSWRAREGAKAN